MLHGWEVNRRIQKRKLNLRTTILKNFALTNLCNVRRNLTVDQDLKRQIYTRKCGRFMNLMNMVDAGLLSRHIKGIPLVIITANILACWQQRSCVRSINRTLSSSHLVANSHVQIEVHQVTDHEWTRCNVCGKLNLASPSTGTYWTMKCTANLNESRRKQAWLIAHAPISCTCWLMASLWAVHLPNEMSLLCCGCWRAWWNYTSKVEELAFVQEIQASGVKYRHIYHKMTAPHKKISWPICDGISS